MRKRRILLALAAGLYLWFMWPMRQYIAVDLGQRLRSLRRRGWDLNPRTP
jgi:hypothetical protein